MNTDTKCPICNSSSQELYILTRKYIADELSKFIGRPFDYLLIANDYKILRCQNCTLEFCDPMVGGDDRFYTELTSNSGYYPIDRAEYPIVCDIIKQKLGLDSRILDVGCGAGDFLSLASSKGFSKIEGIDATASSVQICRDKGLSVTCKKIEDVDETQYDAVVSFHCLEHVNNPLEFVYKALKLLKPGGLLLISTPYSPQVIEYFWFHPLNHPPHHTLRFNLRAYLKLAEITGTEIQTFNFHSASTLSYIRACFSYAVYKDNIPGSSSGILLKMLFHPITALKCIVAVLRREKIQTRTAGPDILVQFKLKDKK